jgi:hypothetical protein
MVAAHEPDNPPLHEVQLLGNKLHLLDLQRVNVTAQRLVQVRRYAAQAIALACARAVQVIPHPQEPRIFLRAEILQILLPSGVRVVRTIAVDITKGNDLDRLLMLYRDRETVNRE